MVSVSIRNPRPGRRAAARTGLHVVACSISQHVRAERCKHGAELDSFRRDRENNDAASIEFFARDRRPGYPTRFSGSGSSASGPGVARFGRRRACRDRAGSWAEQAVEPPDPMKPEPGLPSGPWSCFLGLDGPGPIRLEAAPQGPPRPGKTSRARPDGDRASPQREREIWPNTANRWLMAADEVRGILEKARQDGPGDGRPDRQASPRRGRIGKAAAQRDIASGPRPGPGGDLAKDGRHGRFGRRPGPFQGAD